MTEKTEMNDYSGPWKPDLTFDNFSKEFLLKLMHVWQYAWLQMTEAWYDAVKKNSDTAMANKCETEAWLRIGDRVNPRYAKIANIKLDTIVDSLKALQLPLDNTAGGLFPSQFEIINPNHVIQTVTRCRSLEYFEANDPERIYNVCHINEPQIWRKYLINPRIKVTPLKLPPRQSKDDVACKWEFTLEE